MRPACHDLQRDEQAIRVFVADFQSQHQTLLSFAGKILVKYEIAEGVEDELVLVRLNTLDNVRVGSDYEISTTINELVRQRSLSAVL